MPAEKRDANLAVKIKPSVRAMMEEDRLDKGQSAAEWIERAIRMVVAISDRRKRVEAGDQ
jgi:hypothetical protein